MEDRTLSNNKICQFILRIDLTPDSIIDFSQIAGMLKNDYGQLSTELKVNFNINFQTTEVKREDYITYKLGTPPSVILKLDSFEKAVILMSNHYDNNRIYKDRLSKIIKVISSLNPEAKAQRIGMRYINQFSCLKKSDISKFIEPTVAKSIKSALEKDRIARAMIVHEYQNDSHMRRVQCGIPNKFYPSIISSFDVVLDIDVYGSGIMPIEEWEGNVSEYNHGAYDTFMDYIKNEIIKTLR